MKTHHDRYLSNATLYSPPIAPGPAATPDKPLPRNRERAGLRDVRQPLLQSPTRRGLADVNHRPDSRLHLQEDRHEGAQAHDGAPYSCHKVVGKTCQRRPSLMPRRRPTRNEAETSPLKRRVISVPSCVSMAPSMSHRGKPISQRQLDVLSPRSRPPPKPPGPPTHWPTSSDRQDTRAGLGAKVTRPQPLVRHQTPS